MEREPLLMSDAPGRRYRRKRSPADTTVVIIVCFMYAIALVTIVASLVSTEILEHRTRHYSNVTQQLSNPCILYGRGGTNEIGDNVVCIVTLSGEGLMTLFTVVLFVIGVIRLIIPTRGTFCLVCLTFCILSVSIVLLFTLAMNFTIGSGITCENLSQGCWTLTLNGTNFGQYLSYTMVGLWTSYGALLLSCILEIVFTCCVCCCKGERPRSRSFHYYEQNDWYDRKALARNSTFAD